MDYIQEKRVDVSDETLRKALIVFETPVEFYPQARMMITNEELVLLAAMGVEIRSADELKKIVAENDLADDAEGFIENAWRRVIIDKIEDNEANETKYKAASFSERYPVYAQYEPDKYATIPKSIMDAMCDWEYELYLGARRKNVLYRLKGLELDAKTQRSDFLTQDEVMRIIDECETEINVVPCDCKAMTYYHHKPTDVCLNIGADQFDINSQRSRGYGRKLSKDEAKDLIRECGKAGLMHNVEEARICNCDSASCFPIRMAMDLESRLVYPRANYRIDYQREACTDCGACTKICNFNALSFTAYREVRFDPDKCYGCTICADNCPENAIRVEKI